jgi:hypothetical protein
MQKKVLGTGCILFLMLTFLIGCGDDSSPVSSGGPNSAVVGTWVDAGGLEYIFNANGTITGSAIETINAFFVTFGAPAQKWTYDATQILIDGQPSSPYTVNNNSLSTKDSKGKDIVLTKK